MKEIIAHKKYKILRKCWEINRSQIDEGYLYSEMSVIADNLPRAKASLLDKYKWEVYVNNQEITYITIPVIRCYEGDLLDYNDSEKTRKQIQDIERMNEHNKVLDEILSDKSITHCYIRKRGTYYMSDYCGYTEFKSRAGVYEKAKAVHHARGYEELTVVPINNEEHNDILQRAINDLKTRLI